MSFYLIAAAGLTNCSTPDIAELTTCRHRVSDPWCTSQSCMGKMFKGGTRSRGIRKLGVSRSTTFCPDCNSALHWRLREGKEE